MPKQLDLAAGRLDDRMAALEASDAEVAKLIGCDPEQVEAMRHGDTEIDPEAAVKLRPFLADDDTAARAALARIRRTFHRTYAEGDRAALNLTTTAVGPPVQDGAHYGGSQ